MGISNLSTGLRPGVCTSTTRPSTPFEGQMIYETDTNRVLVYEGAAWVMIADTDTPPALELIKVQTVGSAVASVTVSDCFSSTYENYRITYGGHTGTAGAALNMTLRTSGGVDNAANWRGNTFYVGAGNGAGLINAVVNNSAVCECGGIEADATTTIFDVLGPFTSTRTKTAFTDCGDTYWRTGAFVLVNNTSYTGFKLLPNVGTLTGGTIRVYGYRNTI